MSAPQPRFLETYNSLTDKHLVGYFSNARIRRHLQKSGLISRSGRIIPEKEYRLKAMGRDHHRHVLECLADAISHKILDMERHHQLERRRRLENSLSKDKMQPMKLEQITGSVEEIIHVHCPHPPLAPRSHHVLCPLVAAERAGRSPWRTPGLGVDCCGGCCHHHHHHRIKEPASSKVGQSGELRLVNSLEVVAGLSPYRVPLGSPRRRRRRAPLRPEPSSGCRFYPTTAFNEQVLIRNTKGYPKSPLCSNAFVTMVYRGKSKHVSLREYKDEIRVYQQHCGTENICVYRGELLEGDTFQFTSKRHLGFPFSLTFYLNGLQVERLSSCCEYRYQRCSRLRGRNSYFRVLHVTGAPPCYRCIAAMGLDKKLAPPKKRKAGGHHLCCWRHAMHGGLCDCCIEQKSNSSSATASGRETSVESAEGTQESAEESSEEETESQSGQESEGSQGGTSHSEYEEDFEPDEEVNEEGQTGDQMNGMLESSSDDKTHNLDYGKESECSSQKALQASDREEDESGGYSDGRGSEGDKQERRPADSPRSTQCSTHTDSHAEMMADKENGKEDCIIKITSDSAAHAHRGNGNGEKKLLRMEENQETSALEKKGTDEAEKAKLEALTAREDTRISPENMMAVEHLNPEVNGEFQQTELGESTTNEEEKFPAVPWESRVLDMEEGHQGSPRCEGGAPEGSASAGGRRSLDVQEAAGEGQGQPLGQHGAAGGDAGSTEDAGKAAGEGHSLPRAGTGAVLQECTAGKGSEAQERPKGEGTGALRLGTALSPEQEGMGTLGTPAAGGEGPAGAVPGWEADRAVPQGQEGLTEEEEAAEEGLRGAVGPPVEEEEEEEGEAGPGESLGHGGAAGKDTLVAAGKDAPVAAVPEAEEDVEDADGIARAGGPGGEEAVKDISEGQEAVGQPGALREALGDMETGETVPGGEGFAKPREFSQLKAAGEEGMETGKAVPGAAAAPARQVGGNALRREENTMEEAEEPDKGPALEVAPGLGALRAAPVPEGSLQLQEAPVAQEQGAAEALWGANPSEGSKAGTERAVEGKARGKVAGGSAGAAGAGSGGEEAGTEGAAGPTEPAAGTERGQSGGEVTGDGRAPGDGAPGGTRAGEPGLVAIAVLGGRGIRAGGPGMAQEGVAGAGLGTQSGTGAAVAQELSAEGRAAVGEPGGDGEGAGEGEREAHGPVAGGRAAGGQREASGCEGRAAMPAAAQGRDEAGSLGSPGLGEGLGTGSPGEQMPAETPPSSPGRGDGEPRGSGGTGAEGLCPGTGTVTGTGRGRDGQQQQQDTEQAGGEAEGQQPSPGEDTRDSRDVSTGARSAAGAGEPRKEPRKELGQSPGVPAAADGNQRSCSPRQDGANPDPPVASSEQPRDGEGTLL